MTLAPKSPWLQFSLRTLFVVVMVNGFLLGWLVLELNWIRERQQVRAWLESSEHSWITPSLVGARVQTSASWSLSLFGEKGVVGIGLDVEEFAGPVPYTPATLKRLLPEARVDFSREGIFVDP